MRRHNAVPPFMVLAGFAVSFIGLVGDVRGDQRVVEHFVQCVGDVLRGVGRVEKPRQCAGLQAWRNIGDVVVRGVILVVGKRRVHRIDRLVGDIEDRNDDAPVLDRRAIRAGIDRRGMVAAGPAPVWNALDLRILCAIRY